MDVSLSVPAVEARDISFSYQDYSHASRYFPPVLTHVDFSLPQGGKMVVLGPPDSGKSTLARILTGCIPRYFSGYMEGSVSILGRSMGDAAPWTRVEDISYVAHESTEELVATSCRDEIVFPLESLGMDNRAMEERLAASVKDWSLEQQLDAGGDELSGGERRRLLMAVTQAIDAPILVLDEPFDDLDGSWREKLLEYLNHPRRTVIVFASRPLDIWHGHFDTWAVMDKGCLETGTEKEILYRISHGWGALPPSGQSRSVTVPMEPVPDDEAASTGESSTKKSPAVNFPASHVLKATHVLNATGLSIRHERASSAGTFHLSVSDFHLSSGETVALIGDNGAGKSTFCRVLAGLDVPVAGSVMCDGRQDSALLRGSIGYMFQNPDHQIFLPTVREELAWSFSRRKDIRPETAEEKVLRACSLFRLEAEATPSTMSYGARKRLQAAVCWLLDRPFHVLDEPDAALTYADAFCLVQVLREQGAGILLVSHDREFVSRICSRVYRVADGVLEEVV
ncbi:ATP-binding cassette domain-containing protein [Parasphaerochaeta coccoides]|uniref:ABC transporter related protein n=1 Tax=Parasphaerochaeta coccoides (strain ATCC BAA-1237 / DSM 17374 / SPN1) TaxID=760011 RepID=F4GM58_PARC1|nr:ABC transporter ATP-binding protein [Parasphaerochaeta coccoides]AEC02533.1 ABC transporter related protein [Parasphaerochaeta coccoides DSM 17374]